MGVRENKVERYLDQRVKELGGLTRKWVSPGRDGVPDRIILLEGVVWFVEVKTTDGTLSGAQSREHCRLKESGAKIRTVYGEADVDSFIEELIE